VTVESVSEAGVGMGVGMAVTVVVVVVWDAAFSIAATLAFIFLAGAFDFPACFGPAVAEAVSFSSLSRFTSSALRPVVDRPRLLNSFFNNTTVNEAISFWVAMIAR